MRIDSRMPLQFSPKKYITNKKKRKKQCGNLGDTGVILNIDLQI